MLASDQIKTFIKNQEGFNEVAYKPLKSDRWTIGYGSTYYEDGTPVKEGDTITEETANQLCDNSIDKVARELSQRRIPTTVTQNQFDALVSLVYNIGLSNFNTSNTCKLFYAGESITDKFGRWIYSDGKVVPGLVTRRRKEKQVYDSGEYV